MYLQATNALANRSPMTGVNVLFVDASSDERVLFEKRFGTECSRLTTASSVDEALTVLECGEIELLITEVRLPSRDGFDLVRSMRNLPAEQAGVVPVLAATTWSARDDEVRALHRWFDGYVFKPYQSEDVYSAVADATSAIASLRRLRTRGRVGAVEHRELCTRIAPTDTDACLPEVILGRKR